MEGFAVGGEASPDAAIAMEPEFTLPTRSYGEIPKKRWMSF
jgi:hypothetical protein